MANDSTSIKALISVLRDGEKGFIDVGEHLKHPEHRSFFTNEAQVRAKYATELERTVNQSTGADVHETGTTLGAIHRTYTDLKAKLGGGDATLLETASLGEDAAVKAYQTALDDTDVSSTVRALLAQQLEHVKQSQQQVKLFSQNSPT